MAGALSDLDLFDGCADCNSFQNICKPPVRRRFCIAVSSAEIGESIFEFSKTDPGETFPLQSAGGVPLCKSGVQALQRQKVML